MSKRILVTGSRDWTDRDVIIRHLLTFSGGRGTTLVHGACPEGADAIADEVAADWPWTIERHPAEWDKHPGRSAGYVRNAEMVNLGADIVLAFIMPCRKRGPKCPPGLHDSHGTAMCADLAEASGLRVVRVRGYSLF